MKTSHVLKSPFVVLMFVALLSGCCRYINCDCVFPSLAVFYESDSLACPNDLMVESFNQTTNEAAGEASNPMRDNCIIEFSYQANRYWVISSNALNISDTVRIASVSFHNAGDDCCDCGDQISSMEIDVNGERTPSNTANRRF